MYCEEGERGAVRSNLVWSGFYAVKVVNEYGVSRIPNMESNSETSQEVHKSGEIRRIELKSKS